MKGRYFILYILIILNQQINAFLNEAELKISAALMEALRIDNRILVEEPNSKPKNLHIFKSPMFWNKATSYQNTNQISVYLRKTTFPHPSTLIVYKVDKITSIVNLIKILAKRKKTHVISKFTWLVFVESYKLVEKYEKEFLIPLHSQFIVAFPINSTSYKFKEIYTIKRITLTTDFGTWNEEKLDITRVPWYYRRRNFQNDTLVMGGLKDYGEVGECRYSRHCAYLDFLNTMSTGLNFRLGWIKFSSVADMIAGRDKGDLLDGPYDTLFHSGFAAQSLVYVDVTSQVFQARYNWYIREPTRTKRADYYLQPFEMQVWILVITTSFTAGVIALFLNYPTKPVINETRSEYNPNDDFFMPFDCICNQEGAEPRKKSSSRILCFSVRFLALFIFGAYSATVTSYSAVQELKMPFRNVEEFIENGKYTVGFLSLFQKADLFPEDSPDAIRRGLGKKVAYFDDIAEFREKLCAENYALVAPENDLLKALDKYRCVIQQVENPIFTTWLVMAVRKHSPYKKIFENFLIHFHSSGIGQRTFHKFTYVLIDYEEIDFDDVKFEQIIQILSILAIGVFISTIIFTGEVIISLAKMKIKGSKNDGVMKTIFSWKVYGKIIRSMQRVFNWMSKKLPNRK